MDWECMYERLRSDAEDALAWRELEGRVERWARSVFRGRGHIVEDVTAETCASVALGIAGARGPETFSGFVYGHFLNVRRRTLRTEHFSRWSESLDGVDLPDDAPAEEPDAEAVELVRRALDCLPERERRALRLRYFDELPAERIAAELGVTNGNARRIVFNGLHRLRGRFGAVGTSKGPGALTLASC